MHILLDTNILYWWLYEIERLSGPARDLLADAEGLYVSSASIWEIAIKTSIGKMDAKVDHVLEQIETKDLHALPITFAHARRVVELHLHHKDPFDRLLIAQAITEQFNLLTADTKLKPYSNLVLCV
ncbi:type II toxin-antitoxin system VapC family toxin [Terracidiphilus gabretensis]|jgi:PIN domain nuclease of toxin-antitoxin system|uniref:type II toxin-antitoxin system VapC family toxin n=1 Tax=Terracidiphilus gabretensis TaxID=1577687 RepID=UPI0012F91522|nr:type II toxin-antitoxin system VapC family toxin [Terracidiphilus gabretensis]